MILGMRTRGVRNFFLGLCGWAIGITTVVGQTPAPPPVDPKAGDFFKLPASGSADAPVAAPKPTGTATPAAPSPGFAAPAAHGPAAAATGALPTGSFNMRLYHAYLDSAALIGSKYGWKYPDFLNVGGGEPNLKFLEDDGLKTPMPPAARLGEYLDLEKDPGDGRTPANYLVYVPKHDPQRPLYGVYAHITAAPKGQFQPGFTEVLEKYRLIGIGSDNAGNPITTPMRQWKVLDGIEAIRRKYPTDPARIYVGGTSGGGRMASQMVLMFPELFTGGYYMIGANWYLDTPVQAGFVRSVSPTLVNNVKQRARHVLMTGTKDMNLEGTKAVAGEFTKVGFPHLLQVLPEHGHQAPPAEVFDEGIKFLDAPLMENPEVLFKKSALLATTQPGNAWLGLSQAASRAPNGAAPWVSEALAKAAALKAQYEAEVAVCRAEVESKAPTALMKVRAALKKWGSSVDEQLVRLDNQLKPKK